MSEEFETGLNELYTRAAAAHAAGAGLPTTALVATARRHRRVRAAAVSMATVAAVVGVGFGGAAAIRTFGDAAPMGPAGSPDSTQYPVADTICGRSIDEERGFDTPPSLIALTVDTASASAGQLVTGELRITENEASTSDATYTLGPEGSFVVVQGATIVGVGVGTVDSDSPAAPDSEASATFSVMLATCEALPNTALPPGDYELYFMLPTTQPVDGGHPLLISDPAPFTFTADATTDTPRPPQELGVGGVSHGFTEGQPLADGDYIGHLQGVDAAAGTIDVDLAVWYSGRAAEDYVAANVPGGELLDDYYLADDSPLVTTLPIRTDSRVWEWCFEPTDASPFGYFLRTVDEWATAPTSSGLDVAPTQCSDGANLLRGSLYWFQVSGGVVTQVIGQYVP